jgi:hypothetical protein
VLTLLESKTDITKAQSKLEATMARAFQHRAKRNIGYPAGTTLDANVFTNEKVWYWSADLRQSDVPNPRRLNWFGLYTTKSDLQITVEINTSYSGRNDQIAGFFARDDDRGTEYLLHSGRVGGGTRGVGKSAFLAWSDQRLVRVRDAGGDTRDGIIVMPVAGTGASRAAARYVNQVARFKIAVRTGELATPEFEKKKKEFEDFYAEPRGRRKGKRSSTLDYLSRHGEIVDALHAWRLQAGLPPRARAVKNILLDFGIAIGTALSEAYEVKTSTSRSDLYAGIGQLFVHGAGDGCCRVLVLPHDEAVPAGIAEALTRLSIVVLRFRLSRSSAGILITREREP